MPDKAGPMFMKWENAFLSMNHIQCQGLKRNGFRIYFCKGLASLFTFWLIGFLPM